MIKIYTDGACKGNPGPGGWAFVVPKSKFFEEYEEYGSSEYTTNNEMELTAIVRGLKYLQKQEISEVESIVIHSDSNICVGGINDWINNWRVNGWLTSKGEQVANYKLWRKFDKIVSEMDTVEISAKWVKAHSGIKHNERCDKLASSASSGRGKILTFANDNAEEEEEEKKHTPSGGYPFYFSLVDGKVYKDSKWDQCKNRVHGKSDAKYKKINDEEEYEIYRKKWKL